MKLTWDAVQLLGIILLWIVFLVTQQQKAKYNRCSIGFFAWFGAQAAFLLAATAASTFYQVRKVQKDAEHVDPEMREMLLGHADSAGGCTNLVSL